MKRILMILVVTVLLSTASLAQEPDRWKGMILDQTTPEQALAAFGKPKSDKIGQRFLPLKYDEWFDWKTRDFREIHFEDISGFPDVKLYFRNDKLVAMQLEPKNLKAALVPQSYRRDFEIIFDGFSNMGSRPRYSTDSKVNQPREFPSFYYLMHKADTSYIFVGVDNTSFGRALGTLMIGPMDDVNSVPGKAIRIQLISKSIENRQGNDLLK